MAFAATVPVAMAFALEVGHPTRIKGSSMRPSLRSGDVAFVSKLGGTWTRGEVVALDSPEEPGRILVKRLIGLPHDVVRDPSGRTWNIQPGHMWVEGDAEDTRSRDCRQYGPIPMALLSGHVNLVLYPPSRIGFIDDQPCLESASLVRRSGRIPPTTK